MMKEIIDTNMKYHIVYKTTNLINGKWYIGKHSTSNLNDGYLGSGSHLKSAIRKYGKENFKREIICCCNTEEEAYTKEAELVTMEVVKNPMTYNKMLGGEGGQKRCTDEEIREHRRENQRKWKEVNREYDRERKQEWYQANKERLHECQREYNKANRERKREYQREWRKDNKEYQREWRKANKERMREYRQSNKEYQREYYQANKESIREYQRQYRERKKIAKS